MEDTLLSSLSSAAGAAPSNAPTPSNDQEKPRLLFVDDEPSILTAMRVVFRTGYDVTVTTDAIEAIELLKTKKFDVIVSDQRMPTMTGVKFLCHARDLAPLSVRILLTGYSDTDAIVDAINEVEIHRFLQKPWDNEKLKKTVNEAIELSHTLRETAEDVQVALSQIQTATASATEHKEATSGVEAASASAAVPSTPHESDVDSDKKAVLVVDSQSNIYAETCNKLGDRAQFLHASNVLEVFQILEKTPISAMVCSFDAQSESDRMFLQILKKEHPSILVVAVCDSTDSVRLIELINQAKIYRFIRKPVLIAMLARYITSALEYADKLKEAPALLETQKAEDISQELANNASAQMLQTRFATVKESLASRIGKFVFGFFKRG